MMFKSTILVSLLVISAMAERPHRGPKVGGQHGAKQQFGTYVPRPVTSDQQGAPQQVVYQPQPIQYAQQPVAAGQQYQPAAQYVPQYQPQAQFQQQPIQYQPQQQGIQYQQQQPIQYVQPQVQYQPQPVQYTPTEQVKPVHAFVQTAALAAEEDDEEKDEVVSFKSAAPATSEDTAFIDSVLRSSPSGASLFNVRAGDRTVLTDRLISNYTTIRAHEDIIDTFRCQDKEYGYYADIDNDCQIFHVCHPVHKIPYPTLLKGQQPPPEVTYQYSFICPKWTVFSQDVMNCAWTAEAIPCEQSEFIADVVNAKFFEDVKKISS